MTTQQAFLVAHQHHQAGQLREAETLYRQILIAQPNHAEALHYLGVIAYQTNQHDLAITLIRQSLTFNPGNFAAHSNLGEAYRRAGRLEEAIAAYRRALEINPHHAEAHNNLGIVFKDQGQLAEAAACWRRTIELRPDVPEAFNNMGIILREQGDLEEAEAALRRALQLRPAYADAHTNLGLTLARRGLLDEAVSACRQAVQLQPTDAQAHIHFSNVLRQRGRLDEALLAARRAVDLQPHSAEACLGLGNVLRERGAFDEAMHAFRRTIELQPDEAAAYNNLGIALALQCQLDQALAAFRRAVQLKPSDPDIHNNLGNTLKDQGRLEEAIAAYREALHCVPDYSIAHSNLIYVLHFHPGHDDQSIAAEHEKWNRQIADPLQSAIQPHPHDKSPRRKLRIGYVSPDFRCQAESFFVVPLLEAHDRQQFEIHCYASIARPDSTTERLARCADAWHDVQGLSDHSVAERIRGDGIDILVDLTMHMAHNRLPVFARKPAPVQVAWLAYPGSTGLDTMDYFLTDRYLQPLENERPYYSEQPVPLPDCWVCYDPLTDAPAVNALPAATAAGVTFGSLNNFCKLNDETLERFAHVLRAVEGSRLMLLAPEGSPRQRIFHQFQSHGISPDRITCIAGMPREDYFQLYHGIDIALDPLPYNGITTTCDALWMGVPVVTMAGRTAAGRAGLGILSTLGLPELAARNREEFVQTARRLAGDRSGLAELRRTLRARMQSSPLMDAPRFARHVEAAYRRMWHQWCATPPPPAR